MVQHTFIGHLLCIVLGPRYPTEVYYREGREEMKYNTQVSDLNIWTHSGLLVAVRRTVPCMWESKWRGHEVVGFELGAQV